MLNPMSTETKFTLRTHVKAFRMPPIHDALVVGRASPIGFKAIQKAVELMVAEPVTHIAFPEDEIVSDVLVRTGILRRVPEERLRAYVLERIKPLMGSEEVLHLDMFPEVTLDGQV